MTYDQVVIGFTVFLILVMTLYIVRVQRNYFTIILIAIMVFYVGLLMTRRNETDDTIAQFLQDREKLKKRVIVLFRARTADDKIQEFDTFMYRLVNMRDPTTTNHMIPRGKPSIYVHQMLVDWDDLITKEYQQTTWKLLIKRVIQYYHLPYYKGEFDSPKLPLPENPEIQHIVRNSSFLLSSPNDKDWIRDRLTEYVEWGYYFRSDLRDVLTNWQTIVVAKSPTDAQGILLCIDQHVSQKRKKPNLK